MFAVVVDEIPKLAEESSKFTLEISLIIYELIKEKEMAVHTMEAKRNEIMGVIQHLSAISEENAALQLVY